MIPELARNRSGCYYTMSICVKNSTILTQSQDIEVFAMHLMGNSGHVDSEDWSGFGEDQADLSLFKTQSPHCFSHAVGKYV